MKSPAYYNEKCQIVIDGKTIVGYTNRRSSLVKVGSMYYAKQPTKTTFVLEPVDKQEQGEKRKRTPFFA